MLDMTGKHVIVTGATNGIGEVAALELARMGATVIVISRSESKCKATVDRIKAETGNANVSYLVADLSSIADTRRVASAYKAQFDRLDVLVNNAGALFNDRKESVDGIELTMALNHIGYFVLTGELLDLIKQTAAANPDHGARIVNVSSNAHRISVNWDDLQFNKNFNGFSVYGQSKHMNVLFSYELARRLADTHVTVNVLHPGFVATGFGHNNPAWFSSVLKVIQSLFARSSNDGAATMIYLASSPAVAGVTGKYFVDEKETRSIEATYDQSNWTRLWDITEELIAANTEKVTA